MGEGVARVRIGGGGGCRLVREWLVEVEAMIVGGLSTRTEMMRFRVEMRSDVVVSQTRAWRK